MKNEYFLGSDHTLPYYPILLRNRNDIRLPIRATYLYGVMFDKLSNSQTDEKGRMYIIYDFATMLEDMGTEEKELKDYLHMLECADLIERTAVPGMIYLKKSA
jgi:hypothetical protein